MSSMLGPLRHRRFRRVWLGQLVNVTGDAVYVVVVALYLLPRPDAAHALGLVLGASALGGVVSVLLGGVLADRYRRARIVILSDLLRTVGVLGVIVAGHDAPLAVLAVAGAVVGAGSGIYRPAYSSLIPLLVPAEDIRPASALRSSTNRVAMVVGSALGGVLVAATDPRTALWIDLVTFAVSVLTLVGVREPPPERPNRHAGIVAEARDGLGYVARRPWMSAVLVQGLVQITFVLAPVTILLPLLVGEDSGGYGAILATEGVGAVLGAALAARWGPRRQGLAALAALSAQLPQVIALAVGAGTAVLIPAYFLAGAGLSVFGVYWTTALQLQTPREYLGRVMSVDALANSALSPVGLVFVGWLVPVVGVTAVAWTATVMLVVSIVAVLPVPGVLDFADRTDAVAATGA